MKAYPVRELTIALVLGSAIGGVQATIGSGHGREAVQTGISGSPQNIFKADSEEQTKLHLRCDEASERAERDAGAMIPGRTWTWRLDFERSRQQLHQLQRDFTSLHVSESEFETSLTSEQKSKVKAKLTVLGDLWEHLYKDAQSLDAELRKGYPTRWHVARDAADMQKEIHRWRKTHDQIAKTLGINS
jgi:hypothetical protein